VGTLVVGAFVCGLVTIVVKGMIKDKKNGKTCCGGGCQGCTRCGENNKKQKLR